MTSAKSNAHILDLTSRETLFELAIDENELVGTSGEKLVADLKERAPDAEYTHIYYRDPVRPGIILFTAVTELEQPVRGKLDESKTITEEVFPGFLGSINSESEDEVMKQIPPITQGTTSAMDLVTALEYIVFIHPSMVRAWAALIFTYEEILEHPDGADDARSECVLNCPHAQVVNYLMTGTSA